MIDKIDKIYFLNLLNAGENIEDIGNHIAELMNEAKAEYEANQKKNEIADRKLEIATNMAALFEEYADLAYPDAKSALGDFDPITLVEVLDDSFELISNLKGLADYFKESPLELNKSKIIDAAIKPEVKTLPKKKVKRTDDEILADFLKIFN